MDEPPPCYEDALHMPMFRDDRVSPKPSPQHGCHIDMTDNGESHRNHPSSPRQNEAAETEETNLEYPHEESAETEEIMLSRMEDSYSDVERNIPSRIYQPDGTYSTVDVYIDQAVPTKKCHFARVIALVVFIILLLAGITVIKIRWDGIEQEYPVCPPGNATCLKSTNYIVPVVMMSILAVMCYLFYIGGTFASSVLDFAFFEEHSCQTVCDKMARLRTHNPIIEVQVTCFHMTRNTKHISFTEKVTVPCRRMVDASRILKKQDFKEGITRFYQQKKIAFLDSESQQKFSRICEDLHRANKDRDSYIEISTLIEMPGSEESYRVHSGVYEEEKCLSPAVYLTFTCCILSLCFRAGYHCRTNKLTYTHLKLLEL